MANSKIRKYAIWGASTCIVVAVGLYFILGNKATQKADFKTAVVSKATVSNFITATGTIEPVTEVQIGTQVSGIIDKIYVDYNSTVKAGQVIAEMDKVTLLSDLQSAQATFGGSEAQYNYQKKLYERNKVLYDKELISDSEYEQYEYNYLRAKSEYEKNKAALAKAQRNLSYAVITSPIDGVVTGREVEAGQTVASGFQTPTLFSIAADLTKMQVVAVVDEADISGVRDSAEVSFTVDAYPNDVFYGTVTQIRLGSSKNTTSTSGSGTSVVTYQVIISADNPDLKLKPRLTANVNIYTDVRKDVLTVPNKALRFTPDKSFTGNLKITDCKGRKKVWTLDDKEGFVAHPVKTGISDASRTQIISGLTEGMVIVSEVAIDEEGTEQIQNTEQSPFVNSRRIPKK